MKAVDSERFTTSPLSLLLPAALVGVFPRQAPCRQKENVGESPNMREETNQPASSPAAVGEESYGQAVTSMDQRNNFYRPFFLPAGSYLDDKM
jgi:hypothetical protein